MHVYAYTSSIHFTSVYTVYTYLKYLHIYHLYIVTYSVTSVVLTALSVNNISIFALVLKHKNNEVDSNLNECVVFPGWKGVPDESSFWAPQRGK